MPLSTKTFVFVAVLVTIVLYLGVDNFLGDAKVIDDCSSNLRTCHEEVKKAQGLSFDGQTKETNLREKLATCTSEKKISEEQLKQEKGNVTGLLLRIAKCDSDRSSSEQQSATCKTDQEILQKLQTTLSE